MIDFIVYSLRCRGGFFFLPQGLSKFMTFSAASLVFSLKVRLVSYIFSAPQHFVLNEECNTSMNTAANAGMRLQLDGVFLYREKTYKLNEDMHPVKRCAQV